MKTTIRSVLVGRLAPLGRHGVQSGIMKRSVEEAVPVTFLGLAGDEQGDKKHHGGPEKAVHHYAFDHYARWSRDCPEIRDALRFSGAFGENISTTGLTEALICIGDIFRMGTALVQVSQGRQPCWRLNERFSMPAMARKVQETGRTGWYYRVLEEGHVRAGSALELVERPVKRWTLERVLHVLYHDVDNRSALAEIATLEFLADSWRLLARKRLERAGVEDWSRRLETPDTLPV